MEPISTRELVLLVVPLGAVVTLVCSKIQAKPTSSKSSPITEPKKATKSKGPSVLETAKSHLEDLPIPTARLNSSKINSDAEAEAELDQALAELHADDVEAKREDSKKRKIGKVVGKLPKRGIRKRQG